jgi:hypothetical protein
VDPNPVAQKREARRVEEQAAEAIRRALPASFVAELEGRRYDGADPDDERKRRKIEGSFGLKGYDAPDDVWYAAEKARLEGGEETKMLEAPTDDDALQDDGGDEAPVQVTDFKKPATTVYLVRQLWPLYKASRLGQQLQETKRRLTKLAGH